MNLSSPRSTPDRSPGDKFASLLEMGFQRIEPPPATTASVRIDAHTHKLTQIRPAMGSFVSICALHQSHDLAEHAIGTAFDEMDRLIGLLNRFDTASALSALNDTGRIDDAPAELTDIVGRSLAFGRLTGGAFDITVKPIIDLFRHPVTYAPRTPPDETQLRDALELVGPQHVLVGEHGVRLQRSGMGLTLDGIAKGYVVDGVAATLKAQGASRFLINAGGDIRTGGDRGDESPWTIAVRDPDAVTPSWDSDAWDGAVVPDTIRLADGAVATSGSYEVYFDSERLSHHIVRGGTGCSPNEALSVTVTAPTTMEADALATAVFVLGPAQGTYLIERTRGCECLVIDRHGHQIRSRGWRGNTALSGEQA
jgi:thiamine biosynthesis lipoprotein